VRKIVSLLVLSILLLAGCSRTAEVSAPVKDYVSSTEGLKRVKKLENDSVREVYLVQEAQDLPASMLLIVETEGYNGLITLLVLIDYEHESLTEVSILEHNETDNYGAYAAEDWFLARFQAKDANTDLRLVKIIAQQPEEIVAVTGATVTSQAIVDGVNAAFKVFRDFKEGQ